MQNLLQKELRYKNWDKLLRIINNNINNDNSTNSNNNNNNNNNNNRDIKSL